MRNKINFNTFEGDLLKKWQILVHIELCVFDDLVEWISHADGRKWLQEVSRAFVTSVDSDLNE